MVLTLSVGPPVLKVRSAAYGMPEKVRPYRLGSPWGLVAWPRLLRLLPWRRLERHPDFPDFPDFKIPVPCFTCITLDTMAIG